MFRTASSVLNRLFRRIRPVRTNPVRSKTHQNESVSCDTDYRARCFQERNIKNTAIVDYHERGPITGMGRSRNFGTVHHEMAGNCEVRH
jgi:hypothetical protein